VSARCLLIAPLHLSDDEMARRRTRYEALAGADLSVHLENLEPGAPASLEHTADVEASWRLVAERIASVTPGEADLVMPDCVLDPGVGERTAPRPRGVLVAGILRLSAGLVAGLGERWAAVARNAAIAAELDRRVRGYGLDDDFRGVEVIECDFCTIADAETWQAAMAPVCARLRRQGVRFVLNGCSAVALSTEVVEGVGVLDPTRVALHQLRVLPIGR
jgi:allantoin racemase